MDDFVLIRDMLYERTGLMFEDKKLAFLQPRVARRVSTTGAASPRDYYRMLKYQDPGGREFQSLVEQVTTNETYFFREFPQLESFANDALPKVAEAKRAARDYTLNVWSACCSTGDEPYTLATILSACLDDFPKWKVRLLATDIDTAVLDTARAAEYGERNVKDVPPPYLKEYFTRTRAGYRVKEPVRKMVTFEHLNLMDKAGMRKQKGFDFVFCRNVLIYFDDVSRKQVLGHFYDALVPGGFVFLGHSESVGRISAAFEPVALGGGVMYRKPTVVRAVPGGTR
ncbi:CheR family methyltransferase [Gemmata palustris]|nr:protein-glutamate O-methyltransferase CheR [Gemmata palustris]